MTTQPGKSRVFPQKGAWLKLKKITTYFWFVIVKQKVGCNYFLKNFSDEKGSPAEGSTRLLKPLQMLRQAAVNIPSPIL